MSHNVDATVRVRKQTARIAVYDFNCMPATAGSTVTTPAFCVSGRYFAIVIQPAGALNDESSHGYVGLYLQAEQTMASNPVAVFHGTWDMALIGKDGERWQTKSMQNLIRLEPSVSSGVVADERLPYRSARNYGFSKFMPRADLLAKLGDDDCFYIELVMYEAADTSAHERNEAVDPDQGVAELVRDFTALFRSGRDADVVFVVGEVEFHAHTAIVSARSIVMQRMCCWNETADDAVATASASVHTASLRRVAIEETTPQAFRLLLLYIYTGDIRDAALTRASTDAGEVWLDLRLLAERFQLPHLAQLCECRLLTSFTVENVCDRLNWAVRLSDSDMLRAGCIRYYLEHERQIVQTEAFTRLDSDVMRLLVRQRVESPQADHGKRRLLRRSLPFGRK